MTKKEFLSGATFEMTGPTYERIYRYRINDGGGYMGSLQAASKHLTLDWAFFAHVDDMYSGSVTVVGYWFNELLTKRLLFADMKLFNTPNSLP